MVEKLQIKFLPRASRKTKRGTPVYCRIKLGNSIAEFSTKEYVDIALWSSEFKRLKSKSKQALRSNKALDRLEERILEEYDVAIKKLGYQLTAIKLKNFIFCREDEITGILSLTDQFIKDMKKELAEGSMKNYRYSRRHIADFIHHQYKAKEYDLQDISMKFGMYLERYLKDNTDCTQNGTMKHMQRVKAILNYGVKIECLKFNPLSSFKIVFNKVDPKYLTRDELQKIEKKIFKVKHLDRAKDLFLFACYTGLAYAEVKALSKDDVKLGFDGNLWIFTHRKKTGNAEDVPLLKQAQAILGKYKHTQDLALPMPSNQVMNRHLKTICSIVGIKKRIGYHSGRHTFSTTIALANGIPLETLQKVLGHGSIRSTQVYGHIVNRKVPEDFNKLT